MTYFAIMNGYTTMSLFTLPIGFKYGGYVFSPFILILACVVETFAAVRLIQAARESQIYQYTDLVEYALGKTYRYFFQIFVAVLHFGYSLATLGFFARACMRIVCKINKQATGEELIIYGDGHLDIWIYAGFTLLVIAPITWVRTLEVFQYGNVYSVIVLYLMIVCIAAFCTI